MKYLTNDVINLVHASMEVMLENNARLDKAYKAVRKEFNKCKKMLSKNVVDYYENSHDSYINKIETECCNGTANIKFYIELLYPRKNGLKKGILICNNVKQAKFDVIFDAFDCHLSRIIYTEILYDYIEELWTYNIVIYPLFNEIFIKCETIEWMEEEDNGMGKTVLTNQEN